MKNFSIITLIFVVPLVAYMFLTSPDSSFAGKASAASKPQIIKFTSAMCLDCKKLGTVMKQVYPKYSSKITLTEIQVQNNDQYTQSQVQKYNVTLVPTLVFINSKGKRIAKTEGYMDNAQLEKYMKDLINE